jgi:RNA polymerase sigma-70 factor (ECF subfamily)
MIIPSREPSGFQHQQPSFELIVQHHYRPTLLLAYKLLGDWHEAEDLAQEALLKVHLHFDGLRHPRAIGSWLYRVTRNAALDMLAARRRRPATVSLAGDPDDERAYECAAIFDASAEEMAERAEFWRALRAGLATLHPETSAALVLHDVYGYTYDEIAGRLAIGVSAAKMRVARPHRQMRCALQESP